MLQPDKNEKPVKKERKYRKEAQVDPNLRYQKVIDIKGEVFVFDMKGRQILNEKEFNRFVACMDAYIRPFAASNFRKVPGYEFDDLYNAFIYRLWRCIATFNNESTARVENRASFPTYFMSILRKDLENKRVTKDKSRTIDRLRKKGKEHEANVVQGLVYATPLSSLEPWQVEQLGITYLKEVINDEEDQYELSEVVTMSTIEIAENENKNEAETEAETETEAEAETETETETGSSTDSEEKEEEVIHETISTSNEKNES